MCRLGSVLRRYGPDARNHAREPKEDPYAGMPVDWVSDVECNYPPVTLNMYEGLAGISSGTGLGLIGGVQGIYAQGGKAGRSYGHGHPAYECDRAGEMGGYGGRRV